ncbi:MAG: hypothetical protein P1V81_08405 [Planctomycetota bacterium]|nr:hypothetical protein [Planctomycetota bacterium]
MTRPKHRLTATAAFATLLALVTPTFGQKGSSAAIPLQPVRQATGLVPAQLATTTSTTTTAPSTAPLPKASAKANTSGAEGLAASVIDQLNGALGLGEAADLDRLWYAGLEAHGTSDPLLAELQARIEAGGEEPSADSEAIAARWLAAGIERREGRFEEALDHLEEYIDATDSPTAQYERAALMDARGKTARAKKAYEDLMRDLAKATEVAPDEELSALAGRTRLRLAFLAEEDAEGFGDALSSLALERDDDMRRRAAVVLGLRKAPAKAIDLYVVSEPAEGEDPGTPNTTRFRQEARMAEWALQAGDAPRAQEYAWRAVRSAKLGRDRSYGLALLVEGYRADESIGVLIDRLTGYQATLAEAGESLPVELRDTWIELLREEGRVDEAIELFQSDPDMDTETRRRLLEMYREDGRDAEMIAALQERIALEPERLTWRASLSRYHLERGDRAAAEGVWRSFVAGIGEDVGPKLDDESLLLGFDYLMDQGLDELAITVAERAIEARRGHLAACLRLFSLHQTRGDLSSAEAALERMESMAPADAPERMDLGEAWERLGRLDKAVVVLEGVVAARGVSESGEDLAMHLAWLYSETGDEERALVAWKELWHRVDAVARRRYVEDRLMTVAARLGSLADIAIDLEEKLLAGEANQKETGLLVRLYSKVGDPVSATEVIDEFLRSGGTAEVGTAAERFEAKRSALEEKARVYLSCLDYYHYERTVTELIELDPEGEPDYLRQLAMSQLERGKPNEARAVLTRLKLIEKDVTGSDAAEFEAGVLALAGLRDDAIRAYLRGIAGNPNRIESWLLLGNLMQDAGMKNRAVRIFQHLAETAEQDDLFTIAIDGLLNLEADAATLAWAQRITWERLADRSDKAYLYQLCADLAEAAGDDEGVRVALESSLSVAGERRSSILRELIDRSAGTQTPWGERQGGDEDLELAYSRRLVGLKEIVPPDVFLSIGEAFLRADDPVGAMRTFRMATDVPDRGGFERQTAALFEGAGFPEEALAGYERVLAGEPTSAGLLTKVGEMHERLGREATAHGIFAQAVELLLGRLPVTSIKEDKHAETQARGAFRWWGARNVDDYDRYFDRAQLGFVATMSEGAAGAYLEGLYAQARADFAAGLESAAGIQREEGEALKLALLPRALRRSNFARELAFSLGHSDQAMEFDLGLLASLPGDEALLERLVRERLRAGRVADARVLLDRAERPAKDRERLRFLVGQGAEDSLPTRVSLDEARGLILPLFIEGRNEDAALLLARTNLAGLSSAEVGGIGSLLSAAMFLEDPDLCLRLGREWMRLLFEAGVSEWQLRPVFEKLEKILPKDDFRGLCLYLAQRALDDPEKGANALAFLPELQGSLEEPLFTAEELLELIDSRDDLGYGYGIAPVIQLLPEDMQASALRSALPRMRDRGRGWFLADLITEAREELPPTVVEVILDTYGNAIADEDEQQLSWRVQSFGEATSNLETALAMVDIASGLFPGIAGAASARIKLLDKVGREDEALEVARAAWPELAGADSDDWEKAQALREVETYLAEADLDALLVLIAERRAAEPATSATERANLLWRNERREEAVAVLEEALTAELELDDRKRLLGLQRSYLAGTGKRVEALEVLAKLAELEPDERTHLQQLASGWRSLRNPIKALEVLLQLPPEEETEEETNDANDLTQYGFPPGFSLPPGTQIVINGQMIRVGEAGKQRDVATIQRVKESAEEGDEDTARQLLRRLWRGFEEGIDSNDPYRMVGQGQAYTPTWTWPADAKEAEEPEDEPELPPYRGGLDRYTEPTRAEQPERTSAFDELAKYEFGRQEMRRILATREQAALDTDNTRELIDGLLSARVAASSAEAVRDELVDRVDAGAAGKVDHVMLLALLDNAPELCDERTEVVLADLARTLQAGDLGPLRALARLHARRGKLPEATRLYRWCATKVQPIGSWMGDDEVLIDARELFDEVKLSLADDQDALVQVVQDILFYAASGSDRWNRDEPTIFALNAWIEVLDGAEALGRMRAELDAISNTAFESAPPRRLAMAALPLYLKAGEVDRALVCLEVGLCTFERDLFDSTTYLYPDPSRPGYLSSEDLARLFPADPWDALGLAEGEAPSDAMRADWATWYERSGRAVIDWFATERINAHTASRALALAAWRLAELGQAQAAGELVAAADAAWSAESLIGSQRLWLVDAAAAAGRSDLVSTIERRLFDAGDLHLERLAEVVSAVQEAEGPAAALALADSRLGWCLHPDLIEAGLAAAEAAGNEQRRLELEQLRDEAAEARAELERLDAEAKAKAEAKAEAAEQAKA